MLIGSPVYLLQVCLQTSYHGVSVVVVSLGIRVFFVSVCVHAIYLVVADFGDDHARFFELRQPLDLFHEIGQRRVLVDLYAVPDDRGYHVRARPFHHRDVERGVGVVRQRHGQGVEILEGVSPLMTLLALHCRALLAQEQVRDC